MVGSKKDDSEQTTNTKEMILMGNLLEEVNNQYTLYIINNNIQFIIKMKFSISYPTNGTSKAFQIDDDNKCRAFFQKRMGQEVEADSLGQQFKGYVLRINGGFDKDGFAMKQGVFCNNRIKLLLEPGASGYRAKRKGERKRRSIRGCIVGPDIKTLSLTLVKKGDAEIPGLTTQTKNRRLGPKRATGIRKLYGIQKIEGEKTSAGSVALIKKHAIRRTFSSKKNADKNRHKAPKIQRLVTQSRLRRKRVQKEDRISRWKKSIVKAEQYKKVYDVWAAKRRAEIKERKASKVDAPVVVQKDVKPAVTKSKPETKAPIKPVTKPAVTPAPVVAAKKVEPKKK